MSDELLKHVLEGNAAWVAQLEPHTLVKEPRRRAAVVTCMDSRIDAHHVFGFELGDAHIIRNAGAMVTDDVERSVLLSQYTLETTSVLVVGHTRCGLLGHDEDATADRVEEARGVRPAFALGSLSSAEDGVRTGVERLRSSEVLAHRDDIHGFVYDVDSGLLAEVG